MALGSAKVQQRFDNPREILGDRLREGSIYRLLADRGHSMFGDDYFADCYTDSAKGRPTIPARVMANGHGPPGLRRAVGPGGLRPTRGGPSLAGGLWGRHRGRGLPPDRSGGPAQSPAGLFSAPTPVRGHQGGGDRDRGHEEQGPGSSTRPPSSTRWPPRTPSPSCGLPSARCCPHWTRWGALWPERSGQHWFVTMTTPRRANHPVTGTTGQPVRPWSTPWSVTRWLASLPLTAKRSRPMRPSPLSSSLWWRARTQNKETTGSSASCARWPKTG